jgi:hypothetical protein
MVQSVATQPREAAPATSEGSATPPHGVEMVAVPAGPGVPDLRLLETTSCPGILDKRGDFNELDAGAHAVEAGHPLQ